MMQVDDRTGSVELATAFRRRGISCELTRLSYGDVAFLGNGPEGCPVPVGVEYKQVMDVLKCITDGRFAGHQLPGLMSCYTVVWLLVEGRFRPDRNSGVLQRMNHRGQWVSAMVGQRGFMYRDFMYWLQTMEMKAGLHVWHTYDQTESVAWLHSLYSWWTNKEYEHHRSHLAMDTTGDTPPSGRVALVKPNLVRRIAKELPGVGWEKSAAVSKRFPTVGSMVSASMREWMEIEGVGQIIARRAWEALHK